MQVKYTNTHTHTHTYTHKRTPIATLKFTVEAVSTDEKSYSHTKQHHYSSVLLLYMSSMSDELDLSLVQVKMKHNGSTLPPCSSTLHCFVPVSLS